MWQDMPFPLHKIVSIRVISCLACRAMIQDLPNFQLFHLLSTCTGWPAGIQFLTLWLPHVPYLSQRESQIFHKIKVAMACVLPYKAVLADTTGVTLEKF